MVRFGQIKTQHEKFAVDAGGAPGWILGDHLKDQVADFLGDLLTANPFSRLRDQGPVQTEAGSVPTHHGLWSDDNKRLLPRRSKPASEHPEKFVKKTAALV